MHAYERDLHLILTSRSLSGSALMETALKPNLRPSTGSTPPAITYMTRGRWANIAKLPVFIRK
jgi:hypothetical protein